MYKFKRKPFKHQERMIEDCVRNSEWALFCEMGTGKTQAIINTFQVLHERGEIKRCLIICPNSVKRSWYNEVYINSNYQAIIVSGNLRQRKKLLNTTAEFTIINYESLIYTAGFKDWNRFDMVVLDESSFIKNHKAKRTKFIINTFRYVKRKYIMTGTSITQSPLDIYSQLKFLGDHKMPFKNYYVFRNIFAVMGGYGNYQVVAFKNMHKLKQIIDNTSTQLKKIDCVDLPERIYETLWLDMPEELAEQYYTMKKELVLEISEDESITATIVLTKILRLKQILSGKYLKNQKNNKKMKELLDIISNTKESIIIWCNFVDTIKDISKKLTEMGIKNIKLYGEIKADQRAEDIQLFQEGKVRILVGQIHTGGIGITLTRASIVIYYENNFSLEDRIQSEARVHRIGLKHSVLYIDMVYNNTIDEQILKAISKKQSIAKTLVDSFTASEYKLDKKIKEGKNGQKSRKTA